MVRSCADSSVKSGDASVSQVDVGSSSTVIEGY